MGLNFPNGSSPLVGSSKNDVFNGFRHEADAALVAFRSKRDELRQSVGQGELTPKVARAEASKVAKQLQDELLNRVQEKKPVHRLLSNRLSEQTLKRTQARATPSLESLQRETNRLLQAHLVEQQIQNRADEFRSRTALRPVGGGKPTPTVASLLQFHQVATQSGDEAAREWARRQLENSRDHVVDPDDQRRIDLACDRPERVNQRLVSKYVEQLKESQLEDVEGFISYAIDSRDANACVAAYVLTCQFPENDSQIWLHQVIDGLDDFPEQALQAIRNYESETEAQTTSLLREEVDRIAKIVEAEAKMPGLNAPTEAELERATRIQSLPKADPSEPIGLKLTRRGTLPNELEVPEDSEKGE